MDSLLRMFLSPVDEERLPAEKKLADALQSDLRSTMNELLQTVLVASEVSICEIGAVVFRVQLQKQSIGNAWWKTLSPAERDSLRLAVLDRLRSASTDKLRNHVSQIISQIACMSYDPETQADEWGAVLGDLAKIVSTSGDNFALANSAVKTLGELVKSCPAKFEEGNTMLQLQDMLVGTLMQPPCGREANRLGAVFTMQQVLTSDMVEENPSAFIPGLTALIRAIKPLCMSGVSDNLLEWFKNVIEVIQFQPTLFGIPNSTLARELVLAMLQIAESNSEEFPEDVRKQSMEVVINLISSIPAVLKDDEETIRSTLRTSILLMLQVTDDPNDFSDELEGEECEDEQLLTAGARGIFYICENCGERRVLPILLPMIEEMLNANAQPSIAIPQWRKERAAMISLERALYCGGRIVYGKLKTVLMYIFSFIGNEKAVTKVRNCALDALCAALITFANCEEMFIDDDEEEGEDVEEEVEHPNIQRLFSEDILTAISVSLSEPPLNSIGDWLMKSKAAYCMTAFAFGIEDGEGGDIVSLNAPEILQRLHRLIELSATFQNMQQQQGHSGEDMHENAVHILEVQRKCLEAVGCLAKAMGKLFVPYYDTFMTMSETVYKMQEQAVSVTSVNDNQGGSARWGEKRSELRGTALETISNMGLAAGKEKFATAANSLVAMIINYMDSVWQQGDTDRNRQVAQLCVNIFSWLGEVDAGVLGKVVPRFIEWAKINPLKIEDPDNCVENDEEDENIDRQAIFTQNENGETKEMYLVRNVYLIDEKETAITMLQELVAGVGECLMPWAGVIAETMMKELGSFDSNNSSADEEDEFDVRDLQELAVTEGIQVHAAMTLAQLVESTGKFLRVKQGLNFVNMEQRSFAQKLFDDSLKCMISTMQQIFMEAEEEEAVLIQESRLGKEFDEMEDSSTHVLTTVARQTSSLLGSAFRSGGRSDDDVDVMLSSNYNPDSLLPVFGVEKAAIRDTVTSLMGLIDLSLKRPRGNAWWKESHNNEFVEYISEGIGYILKAHGAEAVPVFGELIFPLVVRLLDAPLNSGNKKNRRSGRKNGNDQNNSFISARLKAMAVFFIDDALEYCGPGAESMVPKVMPYLLEYTQSSNYILRQACCFGLGIAAEKCGESFTPFFRKTVESLIAICEKRGSRKGNAGSATDNAISALQKCIIFRGETAGIPKLLSYLPCVVDVIEARCVHYRLYKLIASGDPAWAPYSDQAKQILRKARLEKIGWNDQKQKFDEEFSILSDETRAWIQSCEQ